MMTTGLGTGKNHVTVVMTMRTHTGDDKHLQETSHVTDMITILMTGKCLHFLPVSMYM